MKQSPISRFLLHILSIIALIFVIIGIGFINHIHQENKEEYEDDIRVELSNLKRHYEDNFLRVSGALTAAEWGVKEYALHYPDSLIGITHGLVKEINAVHSVIITFNPIFIKNQNNISFLSYRDSIGNIHDTEVKGDYTKRDFWKKTIANGVVTVIEPHISQTTGENVISIARPMYYQDTIPYGIISFNFLSSSLQTIVNKSIQSEYLKAFIVNSEGIIISSPDEKWNKQKLSESDCPYFDKEYMHFSDDIIATDWDIHLFCDEKNYFRSNSDSWRLILLFFTGLIFLFAVLLFIAHKLRKSQEKLLGSIIEQHKTEHDLQTAELIQKGMMPKADNAETFGSYNIFGWQKPAKIVGGDLYAYFCRDNKLVFCIGDVSGKGLPASLYMTAAMSAFKVLASHEDSPSEILSRMNNTLSSYETKNTFITMIVGILDLESHVLTYSNAGHNPPVLIENGNSKFIELPVGVPAGIFEGYPYTDMQMKLNEGESLLLYTDGVTEATNEAKTLYGEERLINLTKYLAGLNSDQITGKVIESISEFVKDAEQSDDITMVCINH